MTLPTDRELLIADGFLSAETCLYRDFARFAAAGTRAMGLRLLRSRSCTGELANGVKLNVQRLIGRLR